MTRKMKKKEKQVQSRASGKPYEMSRRKMLTTMTGLGLGSFMLPGLVGSRKAGAATAEESTLDRIKRTGVFNLGARETTPPYGHLDPQNKYVGFSTEIAQKVHACLENELKMKIKMNYTAVTGRTRIPLLQNQTIDMEAGATVITKTRDKVVDFSIPFFVTGTGIMVPEDSPIRTLEDLSGKRIGGHRGGLEEILYSKTLLKQGRIKTPVKYIGFEGHPEGLTALQGGSIAAYTTDAPVLYSLQKSAPDPGKWRIFDAKANVISQAFPLREDSSSFANLVNLTIVEVCESGHWEELYQKYFVPEGMPREKPENLGFLTRMNVWPE